MPRMDGLSMRKLLIAFSLVLCILLSSCSLLGTGTLGSDLDKADARVEQVIKVIQSQDKDALKAMFSKQALNEAQGLDEGIEYLFEFFQGEVRTIKMNGVSPGKSVDYGHIVKEVVSFYSVETDKQKYLFFLIEYTQDTDHPDNVGLYALRVIRAEDKATQFTYWQYMKIAGIYKPKA